MDNHDLRSYDSMIGLLPGVENPTPIVRLNRVTGFEHAEVYAKLEWYNPFGSVKDRVAANMLLDAQSEGLISDHQQLVEPTSGNTGLALAMVGNAYGYALTSPVSNAIPVEKRTILRFFGATVEELDDDLCPAPGAPEGAIARAMEIAKSPDFHMLNQYANPSNPSAHYRTTGPEIWSQTEGSVTHFVAGMGTCGTITGAGRYLKEKNPQVQLIGVHPSEGHDIPGVRSIRQLEQTEFFLPETYDGVLEVGNDEAYDLALRLNREESIPAGPSSGMALAGALAAIPDKPGNRIVVIFPDNAFKYASSLGKHLKDVSAAAAPSPKTRSEEMFDEMIEHARVNPHLTIDADDAHHQWKTEDVFVVDVRQADTYSKGHIPDAVNIPLLDLPDNLQRLPVDLDTPVLAICQRGNTSLPAVLYLNSLGYKNARSITGGIATWSQLGFATDSAETEARK